MNKKLLKSGLSIGSIATIAAPIATIVSCGGNSIGRYDAPDDKKIAILSNYKNTGSNTRAWDAFKKQVDAFNSRGSEKRDGYTVELRHANPVSSTLSTTYESQDKNKIVNMAIDYPDTLGLVSKYDQQLDLSNTDPEVDLSKTFASEFTDINNNIGGLQNGTYSIPITKSTELLAINKYLLGYLLKTVGIKDNNNTKVKKYSDLWDSQTTTSSFTKEEIREIEESYSKKDGYNKKGGFDDSIFEDAAKMLDFAAEVSKAFKISDNSAENDKKSFVFGIDSATNFIYNAINAKFNGDKSKFLFTKDDDSGYIKYQFNNSEVKRVFKEIWKKMKAAIDGGALFIAGEVNGKKQYGSTFFNNNKLAASLGSTAGYSYLGERSKGKDKNNKPWAYYLNKEDIDSLKPFHDWNKSSGNGSTLIQGPSLIALHVNKTEDNATAKFINWFVTKPTDGKSPLSNFTKEAGYIAPTKNNLVSENNPYTSKEEQGNKIAWDELKAVNDKKLNGFDNPVDDTTGSTRSNIQKIIHQEYVQNTEDKKTLAFEKIYKEIEKNFTGRFE